jgi:hypothetical protein
VNETLFEIDLKTCVVWQISGSVPGDINHQNKLKEKGSNPGVPKTERVKDRGDKYTPIR